MSEKLGSFLLKYQCGFRKGFSTKQCLLSMLEKWKSAIDNKKTFGALLTDLSKAFDCLSHDILIAKLNEYGISIADLRLVQNYLSNRKQRTRINSDIGSCEEILFEVPHGFILGPLLSNIFLCDLFFIINETDFASYTDKTVKPVYSGHLRFLKKVSAITRCPLYKVLDFLGKKRQQKLRWRIFFIRYE